MALRPKGSRLQSTIAHRCKHEKGTHVHGSDAAGIEVAAAVGRMKRRADATQEGTAQIINFGLQNISVAAQG